MFTLINSLIGQAGLAGIFWLMIVENVFPLLPSELILPMAGYAAAENRFALWAAILVGGIGSTLGAYAWYALGRRVGIERLVLFAARYGRWLTLTPRDVSAAHA